MKKTGLLIILLSVISSCEKEKIPVESDSNLTIRIGDSLNVHFKRMDILLDINNPQCRGLYPDPAVEYNFDINQDGENDFKVCGYYESPFMSDYLSESYYWVIAPLSQNNKVLCDSIYFCKEDFIIALKPLFKNDKVSVTGELWFISPPAIDPKITFHGHFIPVSDKFLLYYCYYQKPSSIDAKGYIDWTNWMNMHEKYVGLLSENSESLTLGWIKLSIISQSVILIQTIGTKNIIKNN